MKKCPFCKAEIEDNARFCLYCMKPLVDKEGIAPPPKRRMPWIPLAIVLVLCLSVVLVLTRGKPVRNPTTIHNTTGQKADPEQPDDPPVEDEPSAEQPDDPPVEGEPSPCEHSYALTDSQATTCTTDGFSIYTCSKCGNSYQEPVPAAGHQYTPATCLISQVCKECSQMYGNPLGHSYSDGYCVRCNAPDYKNPKVVFEYREVGPNDYFDPDSYIPGSDIVITGVKNPTSDGVYEVPSYLDGKRIVGITSLAFTGTDARKVILGETIIRINQNAFSGCYNIESLYIKSDRLFLSRSALVDAVHRNCALTIYCSSTCMVDDDLYGECYLKDIARTLGAVWEEWDG